MDTGRDRRQEPAETYRGVRGAGDPSRLGEGGEEGAAGSESIARVSEESTADPGKGRQEVKISDWQLVISNWSAGLSSVLMFALLTFQ